MQDDFYINNPKNIDFDNVTTEIFKKENPLKFHKSLEIYKPTPLHSLPNLAKKYGIGNLYIKDESYRFNLNAFKVLGASFAMNKLLENNSDIDTFCTATDGNHGRAVAWSARMQNKKSVVFVPQNTVKERIQNIEKEGAKVINTGKNYDETCKIANETAKQNNWILIQDTAWNGYEEIPSYIMSGYFTQIQEIENQIDINKVDLVMLQAGVGSWPASVIWYIRNKLNSNIKLVIVEPYESDGILESFKQGKRVIPNGNQNTIMAGLNCGIPSLNAWDIIENYANASIRIKDKYAIKAINELYYPISDDIKIISGESGVGGLAGLICLLLEDSFKNLKKHLNISTNTNVLCISTEGDTDKENFKNIITKSNLN